MPSTPKYLRTSELIDRLQIPGATPDARKRRFYALCSQLGLRELGQRQGRGEWLFPVREVERRYHEQLMKEIL